MDSIPFPVIDLVATGNNIQRLRQERGLSVRDLQRYFGFEEPRAIYKWQKGESLPTVDNLYALGILLEVPMDGILIPVKRHSAKEQRETRCSVFWHISDMVPCKWQDQRIIAPSSLPDKYLISS
jgi:transcriptional regulator with XRE-family HTH domain